MYTPKRAGAVSAIRKENRKALQGLIFMVVLIISAGYITCWAVYLLA